LIIFSGIVTRIPSNVGQLLTGNYQQVIPMAIFLVLLTLTTIFVIVYVQEGRRNVPVMYPGRRVGNRMSMPVKGTLPLMVNMAGMIPIIFAQSILTFPAVLAQFFIGSENVTIQNIAVFLQNTFGGFSDIYWILYFLMVVAFTFFYTDVLFSQQNYGENLKRSGAQIPGVTKGAATQRYLTFLVGLIWPMGDSNTGLLLVSSSGLLIVVGVVRDLYRSIEAELKLRGYDQAVLVR